MLKPHFPMKTVLQGYHAYPCPDFETNPQDGLVTESERIGYTMLYRQYHVITPVPSHGESSFFSPGTRGCGAHCAAAACISPPRRGWGPGGPRSGPPNSRSCA